MGMGSLKKFRLVLAFTAVSGVAFAQEVAVEAEPVTMEEVAAVEAVEITTAAAVDSNYPVSIDFKAANIKMVLAELADSRPNTSLTVDEDVTGEVTITLRQVPWEQALKLILEPRGFEAVKISDNIFRVKKATKTSTISTENTNLNVSMYTTEELEALSTKELKQLLGHLPGVNSMSEEEMRARIASGSGLYIKKLFVDKQPVLEVLGLLARQAELNFSFTSHAEAFKQSMATAVAGQPGPTAPAQEMNVSLNLRNLPYEKVLSMVAARGGYSALYKDGIWEIAPRRPEASQPLELGYFEVEFLPIDGELISILKSLISQRSEVRAGKNKILIVRGTADELANIRRTLEVMDKPTPQVSIEARFFELNDNDSKYVGLDWTSAFGPNGNAMNVTIGTGRIGGGFTDGDATQVPLPLPSGNLTNLDDFVDNSNGFRGVTTGVAFDVSTAVRLLKEDLGAKQLANPKVIVASGEQATIHIGEKEPIIKTEISTEEGSSKITTQLDTNYGKGGTIAVDLTGDEKSKLKEIFESGLTPGYLDLGTILTVAPVVKNDDSVYIQVIPNLVRKIDEVTVGGEENPNKYPVLFNTKVHTEFTISSGQTVAIGGLVNESESNNSTHVPYLNKIPLLGRLFEYESTQKVRSETIIFLTVNVVESGELKTTTGIPIKGKLVAEEVETIMQEDRLGGEFRLPEKVEETEIAEEAAEEAEAVEPTVIVEPVTEEVVAEDTEAVQVEVVTEPTTDEVIEAVVEEVDAEAVEPAEEAIDAEVVEPTTEEVEAVEATVEEVETEVVTPAAEVEAQVEEAVEVELPEQPAENVVVDDIIK